MRIERHLDRLHAAARSRRALYWFAWINRVLLAVAFVPSGLKKALGHRFTQIPVTDPVGFFFEAMYRTGPYYRFIGLVQLGAAVLLLLPRTTHLGALVYLPIAVNIFIITVSMHFTGTPFVTGGMLLACLFLVCWHYDRWKTVIFAPTRTA